MPRQAGTIAAATTSPLATSSPRNGLTPDGRGGGDGIRRTILANASRVLRQRRRREWCGGRSGNGAGRMADAAEMLAALKFVHDLHNQPDRAPVSSRSMHS
jgi:hypothetical protein